MTPWNTRESRVERKLRIRSILYTLLLVIASGILGGVLWFNFKPAKFNLFEDPQTGTSIRYPLDWKKVDRPAPGAIVAFIAPKKSELELFSPNMNVTYVDLKEKKSLSQLKQETMQQMSALFKGNIKVLEDTPFFIAGRAGQKLVFVGVGIDTPLQYLLAWVMVGDRVYVVTYSNLAKNYNDNIEQVNAVIRSFRIK